ncbi:MAG: polymer-forming cytoskeletal protein [Betaproteobacteria bacterium]|nr:polymer-forming cytoskeletal protein [Betaproteobacteria bacterium]
MFGTKDSSTKPQSRIDSLIGVGTTLEGNISFNGGLRVDGKITGNVSCVGDQAGTLVISEQAEVNGEIRVNHVIVNGRVSGPIHASDTLDLQAKAHVTGDVHYRRLEIQGGAVVQGMLVCDDAAQSEKVVPLKSASSD